MALGGILFDKDGTLFDFAGTWNGWAKSVIADFAEGDDDLARAIAAALKFDLELGSFTPDSPVIAGTTWQAAERVAAVLPGRDAEWVAGFLNRRAAAAELVPATPLLPLMQALAARQLKLGVMTNDAESSARAHLRAAGVEEMFDFIAGFDSGFGEKPDPAPLLAFARAGGLTPGACAMVGDSTHDLLAGRAAGMTTVAVLTGMAPAEELAPHADVVLPDIGHLPAWLDTRAGSTPAFPFLIE